MYEHVLNLDVKTSYYENIKWIDPETGIQWFAAYDFPLATLGYHVPEENRIQTEQQCNFNTVEKMVNDQMTLIRLFQATQVTYEIGPLTRSGL